MLYSQIESKIAEVTVAADDTAESVRRDALAYFGRLPEPPLYRRRDEPMRLGVLALIAEGIALFARARPLGSRAEEIQAALGAHLEWLCLVSEGKVEAAEPAWRGALHKERGLAASLRLWKRNDEDPGIVFDRRTGASRFDPRPDPQVSSKLACPNCRKVAEYAFSPHTPMHSFVCTSCKSAFEVYFAEARATEVTTRTANRKHYVFRVEELTGKQTRIEFDDASNGVLTSASRDLLAFIYTPKDVLRGVLNLNSSRVLWLGHKGPCFVASAVFQEGERELHRLRVFRDNFLLPHAVGRLFVDAYYRVGPAAARFVSRFPLARSLLRAGISLFVLTLEALKSPDGPSEDER